MGAKSTELKNETVLVDKRRISLCRVKPCLGDEIQIESPAGDSFKGGRPSFAGHSPNLLLPHGYRPDSLCRLALIGILLVF